MSEVTTTTMCVLVVLLNYQAKVQRGEVIIYIDFEVEYCGLAVC